MSNTDKRTPGPWATGYGSIGTFGIYVEKELDTHEVTTPICNISPSNKINDTDKANGAFIIRACNNHDALLSALRFCMSVIESQGMFELSERMAVDKARKAIKDATE